MRDSGKMKTMEYPYINLLTPDRPRDLLYHTTVNKIQRATKINAHGAIPFDYMIAELF